MPNLIACRVASYGEFAERAWTHLPEIGIRHVEIDVPADDAVDAVRRRLADHGLAASSLGGRCSIEAADAVEVMKPQLATCAALGARICFLSVHAGEADRAEVYGRLHALGAAAAAQNVTVALETHPDLMSSGDVARQTMAAVDHPNVRVNFDTANIYYYNENVTAPTELAKVLDHVGAVHLKDSRGRPHTWDFPALGAGIVDFPEVFRMLDDHGFDGPCTMELEGSEGITFDEAGRLQYVADSVAYLRRIGAFGEPG